MALGVEGGGAGAGADVDVPTCEAAGQVGSIRSRAPLFGLFARVGLGDLGLGAVGDAGQLGREARRQGGFDPGQALGAVFAGELEEEAGCRRRRRDSVPALSLGRLASASPLPGRRRRPGRRWSGSSLRGRRLRLRRRAPGGEVCGRWCSLPAAGRRGDQRPARAAEEVDLDVFERQLGVFFERGGDLARFGDRVRLRRRAWRRCRSSGLRPPGRWPAASRRGWQRAWRCRRSRAGVRASGFVFDDLFRLRVFVSRHQQRRGDFEAADLGRVGAGLGLLGEVESPRFGFVFEADLDLRVQAPRPAAWEGFTARPAGKVTLASRGRGAASRRSLSAGAGAGRSQAPRGSRCVGRRGDFDRRFEFELAAARDRDRGAAEVGALHRWFRVHRIRGRFLPAVGAGAVERWRPEQEPGSVRKAVFCASTGQAPPSLRHLRRGSHRGLRLRDRPRSGPERRRSAAGRGRARRGWRPRSRSRCRERTPRMCGTKMPTLATLVAISAAAPGRRDHVVEVGAERGGTTAFAEQGGDVDDADLGCIGAALCWSVRPRCRAPASRRGRRPSRGQLDVKSRGWPSLVSPSPGFLVGKAEGDRLLVGVGAGQCLGGASALVGERR